MYEELYILIIDNLVKERLHKTHTLEVGNECLCEVCLQ